MDGAAAASNLIGPIALKKWGSREGLPDVVATSAAGGPCHAQSEQTSSPSWGRHTHVSQSSAWAYAVRNEC